MRYRKYWVWFRDIDKNVKLNSCFLRIFRQFLSEFTLFLKTVFSDETPINRDKILSSVPSVESIKQMTIIEAKMRQNGKRSKCATFY